MPAQTISERKPAALLSVAAANENNETALATVGGKTLLEHQISALRQIGIKRFLIEVDNVPGALIALADNIRQTGCSVDFVRSAQDLQALAGGDDYVIVLAEGVFITPPLILSLITQPGLFIATVDGRDENEVFERMDLNTRWAGLAIIDGKTINSLGKLPDGWSMASSLLRQAMRDNVAQHLLKQHLVQSGDIRKIAVGDSSADLTRQILSTRMAREPGFIESRIFAPLSQMLASHVWKYRSGKVALEGIMLSLGSATMALAIAGWPLTAIGIAILVLFVRSVRLVTYETDLDHSVSKWVEPLNWALLAGAVFAGSTIDGYRNTDSMFAATMMVGLALLAKQLRLPKWGEKTLQSPTLLAVLTLLLTMPLGFAAAAKWVSVAQLILLLVAKWTYKQKT